MDKMFLVLGYFEHETEVIGLWETEEEADKAIIRDIKRNCWVGGAELNEISNREIEQAYERYAITEIPIMTDIDYMGSELVIDGYPLESVQ